MAEQTSLLTDEDVTEIGSVLKLAPHERSSQFESVGRSSEGEPLVSLDELYEKTGQESINRVISGFKMITERKRLARSHGEALNIQGSESWIAIPDTLNAIRGGEGFFSAVKDGIVTIVKAIIRFIKGVANWIAERFRRIFGLEQTINQVKFLNENSNEINSKVAEVVKHLGGNKDYSPEEMYLSMPKGEMPETQLMLIKSRLDGYEETFKRIENSIPAFEEATRMLKKIGDSANRANDNYRKAIDNLKRKFKNKDVSSADIQRFVSVIETEFFVTLDYSDMAGVMELLYKEFYGIEVKDLGVEGGVSKARELLKDSTEIVKARVDPKMVEMAATASRVISAKLNTPNKAGLTAENIKVSQKTLDKFSDMITLKDAEFINELATNLASVDGVATLPAIYTAFTARVREFTLDVEILLKAIQEISKTYVNLSQWYTRLSLMMANYVTGDVKRIIEAHNKYLTPDEKKAVETDKGVPIVIMDMEESFNRKYPGLNIPEDVSMLMKSIQEVEQVNKPLTRFITTMKG